MLPGDLEVEVPKGTVCTIATLLHGDAQCNALFYTVRETPLLMCLFTSGILT